MICCCFFYFRNKWDNTLYVYLLMRYIFGVSLERWKSWADIQFTKKKTHNNYEIIWKFNNLLCCFIELLCLCEDGVRSKINLIIIQLLEQVDFNWCQKVVHLVQRLSTSERDKNIQVQRNVKNCRCFVGMVNKKLWIHHLRFLLINIFYWNALKSMS